MNIRYQYLRDHSGQPVGCVVIKAQSSEQATAVSFQLSVLNPVDRFNRTMAREIALARLYKSPKVVVLMDEFPSMHDITFSVMKAMSIGKDAPSRARKAAKLWIQKYTGESFLERMRSEYGVY